MCELVHNCDGRVPLDNCFDVHLFHSDAAIFNVTKRQAFKITDHCRRVLAIMCFNDSNGDVHSLFFQQVRIFQHLVGFADAWSGANVDAQLRLPAMIQLGEKRFGGGT